MGPSHVVLLFTGGVELVMDIFAVRLCTQGNDMHGDPSDVGG